MTNKVPADNKHCVCCEESVHEWHRRPGGGWGQHEELALVSRDAWCAGDKGGHCNSLEVHRATGKEL